jgi:hypothetical protein
MTRLTGAGFLAATLLSTLPAQAQTQYTCGMGTIRGIETAFDTGSARTAESAGSPWGMKRSPFNSFDASPEVVELAEDTKTEKIFLVTVQLDDGLYTGRASEATQENPDPARLAVDGRVSVCVNKTQMILDSLDGKDYRAKLVRKVRGQKSETATP